MASSTRSAAERGERDSSGAAKGEGTVDGGRPRVAEEDGRTGRETERRTGRRKGRRVTAPVYPGLFCPTWSLRRLLFDGQPSSDQIRLPARRRFSRGNAGFHCTELAA